MDFNKFSNNLKQKVLEIPEELQKFGALPVENNAPPELNLSGALEMLPVQQRRNNTGFPSAYPVPESTPFADFGRGILDAFSYTPDPNKTFMERSFVPLAADMESMISGFDAKGNKVPDSLRMMSLMMPGGTGLGGKAGLGILGAVTGAAPKVGSAYASRLIPTLENMPQDKMSAEQFSGWLSKQPVGADELEYSGILGLLNEGGDVTKTRLLDQARANPLDIQDVVLGAPPSYTYDKKRLAALENEHANLTEHAIDTPSFGEAKYNEMIKLMNIRDKSTTQSLYALADEKMKAGQIAQRRGNNELAESFFEEYNFLNTRAEKLDLEDLGALPVPTKFSDYQLPGGEDYREMLLTLPKGRPKDAAAYDKQLMGFVDRAVAKFKEDTVAGGMLEADAAELAQRVFEPDNRREYFSKAAKYLGEEDEMRAVSEAYFAKAQRPSDFKSGHFDEPNVLAHARYNTRTIDGDKTLFIEEIQSDWHQKGRDVGYKYDATYKAQKTRMAELEKKGPSTTDAERAEYSDLEDLTTEYDQMGKVPDAPYKRTDKWAGLTLQRMVKEAVDSGHDRIAWTSGKVQAERYDLSQQLDSIDVYDEGGKRLVDINDTNNIHVMESPIDIETGLIESGNFQGKFLEDVVGKEMSEKILGSVGDVSFAGTDLQIGGDGMKEFYDKMLVKSANKFGKKYGAKAEITNMSNVNNEDLLVAQNDPSTYSQYENWIEEKGLDFDNEDIAYSEKLWTEFLDDIAEDSGFKGAGQVWSMKITPEMKAGISKGVMLGQTGAEGKVAAGLLSQDDDEQMPSDLPMRDLLGGTLYTATTPDGFI